MHSRLIRGACAALVAAAALGAAPASAGIAHSTLADGTEGIYVTGEIQLGDDAAFRDITGRFPDAVVFLESPGGTVIPALEIGRLVRERGYRTVVIEGGTCASSCALIWLAGAPRHLAPGARVGFHASSTQGEDGRLVESGLSNAFVGYYLSKLELSESAVVFATMTSPYALNWLTAENSEGAGISFESTLQSVPAPDPAYFASAEPLQKAPAPVIETAAAPPSSPAEPG